MVWYGFFFYLDRGKTLSLINERMLKEKKTLRESRSKFQLTGHEEEGGGGDGRTASAPLQYMCRGERINEEEVRIGLAHY